MTLREELKGTNSDLIKQFIINKPGLSRDKICKSLNIRITEARRIFNHLRDDGIIMYDSKARSWYVV